jgi:hypothetical protein
MWKTEKLSVTELDLPLCPFAGKALLTGVGIVAEHSCTLTYAQRIL